ncbi:MAG: alpha/beta hydrolase [Deltaproteobacteria bacterium]|nr:alpha/beta hydrolase [Deltaproteobacteria bacterium]MCB9789245.1 alpha/beta hydrolase [Deltaproteobacteria bacterium]
MLTVAWLTAAAIAAGAGWLIARLVRVRRRLSWAPPSGLGRALGLHVRDLGSGDPPIVLLHGLAASGRYFGAAFEALASEHRLVVPDLLGFGRSPRPKQASYSVEEHVAAVLDVLDSLRISARFWAVGHSTGSVLALELAALHPERVAGVIAFGPPIYASSVEARRRLTQMGWMVRLMTIETRFARAFCEWICAHRELAAWLAPLARPDLPAPIARDGVQHTWTSYSATLLRVVLESDSANLVSAAMIPVHLVTGQDDPVPDRARLEQLDRDNTQVHLHAWPGGHDLPLTQPGRCVALIRDLTDQMGARSAQARAGSAP